MRKGIAITLYLDEQTVASLDSEVQRRIVRDRENGLTGYKVANRSKVASEAISYALMEWSEKGLSLADIARLTKPIFMEHELEYVAIFGSFARGEQTSDSDVDFLVKIGRPMGLSFFSMKEQLEQALGRSVDVLSVDACSEELLQNISKESVSIYAA